MHGSELSVLRKVGRFHPHASDPISVLSLEGKPGSCTAKTEAVPAVQGRADVSFRLGAGRIFVGECHPRRPEGSGKDLFPGGRNLPGIPLFCKPASHQRAGGGTVRGPGAQERRGGYPEFRFGAVGGQKDRRGYRKDPAAVRADGRGQDRCAAGDRSVCGGKADGADGHELYARGDHRLPEGHFAGLSRGPVRQYRRSLHHDGMSGCLFRSLDAGKKDNGGRLWFYTC